LILPDVNLLVYAYHAQTPRHEEAAAWLKTVLASGKQLGLAWPVIWGFIRVSTNARLWPIPMPPAVAVGTVRTLLGMPNVSLLEPGARHLVLLEQLTREHSVSGPMVSDAVLAALAIEHGATLASTDRDFQRFESLGWVNPLDS
jgi:uncharacterized protein